jgi:hypothetical protein
MVAVRKLLFLVSYGLLASAAFGSATAVYVSQSGGTFSGGSACNGQTTISLATLNNSSSWGSGATQTGPGTTVYLCGALTASAGAVGVNVQNSGTSGSPLTILFDTGATLKSPAFAGGNIESNGCSSACAAIQAISKSYVIIDGGSNGLIENTLNGAPSMSCPGGTCAQDGASVGVYFGGGSNAIIRNLTIKDIYIACGATNCGDTNGSGVTAEIRVDNSANNVLVCNNTLSDAYIGINPGGAGGTVTPTASLNCSSNTFPTGIQMYWNTLNDNCHHIQINGSGQADVGFNFIGTFTNWIWPGNGNGCHTDGIIVFGDSTKVTAYIHHNEFSGDLGLGSPTGEIYCTYGGGESECYDYDNLFVGIGNDPTCCQGISFAVDGAPGAMGPYYELNNTISGYLYMFEEYGALATSTFNFRNNIFLTPSGGYHYQQQNGGPFSNTTVNGNLYNAGRSVPWGWGGMLAGSVPTWQSDCASGSGTLCDSSTSTTAANLSANYVPNSGSPAIGLGDNLTSLSIPALNVGAPQSFGAGGSCGTGCVVRSSSGAWDAGAYPYSSSGPPAPTKLTAQVN